MELTRVNMEVVAAPHSPNATRCEPRAARMLLIRSRISSCPPSQACAAFLRIPQSAEGARWGMGGLSAASYFAWAWQLICTRSMPSIRSNHVAGPTVACWAVSAGFGGGLRWSNDRPPPCRPALKPGGLPVVWGPDPSVLSASSLDPRGRYRTV